MAREIKFRFFRKEPSPKMIYPKKSFYVDAVTGKAFGIINYSEDRTEMKGLDLIVMQFTGLNDKNGKEIYEGDIIKMSSGLITEVVYNNGGFKYLDFEGDDRPINSSSAIRCEIVGNTYETKILNLK